MKQKKGGGASIPASGRAQKDELKFEPQIFVKMKKKKKLSMCTESLGLAWLGLKLVLAFHCIGTGLIRFTISISYYATCKPKVMLRSGKSLTSKLLLFSKRYLIIWHY